MATHPTPCINENPAHAAVCAAFGRLKQTEIESFFSRITRHNHAHALLLREVLFWMMPCRDDKDRPRTTIHRDGHYWFSRTQEQWRDENDLSRKQLEKAYERCAAFLVVDHFRFNRDRTTHYRFDFGKLRELIEADEILQSRLNKNAPNCAMRGIPECPMGDTVECSTGGTPSITSQEESKGKLNNTGCAGPAAPVLVVPPSAAGAAAPNPPPEEPEQESEPDFIPIPVPNALEFVKRLEGKTLHKKFEQVTPLSGRNQRALGYLLVWQREFELEYGSSPYFNTSHIFSAYQLAEQGVGIKHFHGVLRDAWTIRGVSAPGDPLFMCRNHSRKFGLFCRHFHRMEDELEQTA